MSVAKITEIKASSTQCFEDAVKAGIKRANKSLENIKSAWVQEQEVKVGKNGSIKEYRVLLKVTFVLK